MKHLNQKKFPSIATPKQIIEKTHLFIRFSNIKNQVQHKYKLQEKLESKAVALI